MPRNRRKPAYLLHKASGQARVRIAGKDHYLGPHGSAESHECYDRLISEWLRRQDVGRYTIRVDDLALLYLRHCDDFYRKPDGTPTSEPTCMRQALRFLVTERGRTLAADFGPLALKAVRQAMIDTGHSRKTINENVHRIRRAFRWGVENEIVPQSVVGALECVASLKAGRSAAKESPPVRAVADGVVEKTLLHLPTVVQAMVRLQLLTGARPGEICGLRPCDVTLETEGVWTYRPASHKTQHHGKERRIFIGPQGQEILRPFLDRKPDEHCFSPVEAERERNEARRAARKSPMTPSHAARRPAESRKRPPRTFYTQTSYCRAICRACQIAFDMPPQLRTIHRRAKGSDGKMRERTLAEITDLRQQASEWNAANAWSPNQLRHSRATLLRKLYGVEAARLVLGHSDPGVTLVYAERDFEAASKIMREIG